MKCPNCSSHMFVASESSGEKSQVTFFRCSICSSEHVASEPKQQVTDQSTHDYFGVSANTSSKPILMT